MKSERLRIVQTLSQLDGPVGIDALVKHSGLSRGKVLGNLPRLCIDGLVDKRGRQYTIAERGRAVIWELKPVPEHKQFHFYLQENKPAGYVARNFKDFYEIIKMVDARSLYFHIRRGDFENWIQEVLHDKELASAVVELRKMGLLGEALREKLCEYVGRQNNMLNTLLSEE